MASKLGGKQARGQASSGATRRQSEAAGGNRCENAFPASWVSMAMICPEPSGMTGAFLLFSPRRHFPLERGAVSVTLINIADLTVNLRAIKKYS